MVVIEIIPIGLFRIGRRNSPYRVGGLLVVDLAAVDGVDGVVSFYFVTCTLDRSVCISII